MEISKHLTTSTTTPTLRYRTPSMRSGASTPQSDLDSAHGEGSLHCNSSSGAQQGGGNVSPPPLTVREEHHEDGGEAGNNAGSNSNHNGSVSHAQSRSSPNNGNGKAPSSASTGGSKEKASGAPPSSTNPATNTNASAQQQPPMQIYYNDPYRGRVVGHGSAPASNHSGGKPASASGSVGRPSQTGSKVEFGTAEVISQRSFSARDNTSPAPSISGREMDGESIPDVWDNTSEVSMSGYSAHSGKVDEIENVHASYFVRLVKFYQKYNPDKLCRVEEFLAAYKGEEEQLFAILTEKYGPEPEALTSKGSDGSYFHAVGGKNPVPKFVTPEDGKTTVNTPYWPMSSAITDPDLMSLLRKQVTSVVELQKCYIGVLKDHPKDSWNGMTYITEQELPSDNSQPFLGHLWSGSLANNKVLVHNKESYHRCVLHCSDACQHTYPHQRWRLTLYRHESETKLLIRSVWDPVITSGGTKLPESSKNRKPDAEQSNSSKPFFSFSWAKKKQSTPTGSMQPTPRGSSRVGAETPGSVSSSSTMDIRDKQVVAQQAQARTLRREQPQQPQANVSSAALSGSVVDRFITQLQALEGRIGERLDDMDKRLQVLEKVVLEDHQERSRRRRGRARSNSQLSGDFNNEYDRESEVGSVQGEGPKSPLLPEYSEAKKVEKSQGEK